MLISDGNSESDETTVTTANENHTIAKSIRLNTNNKQYNAYCKRSAFFFCLYLNLYNVNRNCGRRSFPRQKWSETETAA
jgi:hypothetical protein